MLLHHRKHLAWVVLFSFMSVLSLPVIAEEDYSSEEEERESTQERVLQPRRGSNKDTNTNSYKSNSTSSSSSNSNSSYQYNSNRYHKKLEGRKYLTDSPERSDAGIFHVALAVGGNFYIEPKIDPNTKSPLGDYFKNFGFQGGAYFDYDYSELPQNIPLALRGFIGYKYILQSVHVFTFDGMVRRMFQFSEHASFGIGLGGSAALWYRAVTDTSPQEEILFLPSFIIGAGFEFNPFMVDFKWLINRFGEDSTITGLELYFGLRL